MNFIEKLIYSLENKYIVSIEYNKSDCATLIQVIPIIVFRHNQKEYLLAEETRTGTIKTYTLSNIERIEITPLKFDKEYNNPNEYINKKFFRNEVKRIQNLKDIESKNISSKNKYSNIVTYMIESLRSEEINDILFYDDSRDIYQFNAENLVKVLKREYSEVLLPYNFKSIYSLWDKELRRTPDLSIYVSYPNIKKGNRIIPILYFKCSYNIDKNTISDIDKGYINEKLCDEVIELTEEEIKDLIGKGISIDDISLLIDDNIDNYELLSSAYLFLHKDPMAIKSVLSDIKNIENTQIRDITKPLKILFECNNNYQIEKTCKNPLMIVQNNEMQELAVLRSQNNIVSVIQGPPGTGKTQTILNIIITNLISGMKTLVTSTNNKAVDNVYEKLLELDLPRFFLRLGNQEVRKITYDQFNDILSELKSFKASNKADVEALLDEKKSLIDKDTSCNNTYKKWLEKLEYYYDLVKKARDLKENLEIEYNKLINRDIMIPDNNFYPNLDSSQLLINLEKLESELVKIVNRQEGNWTFYEKAIGLFINIEKRYVRKTSKRLRTIITVDKYTDSLGDFAWQITKNIDVYRYAFTDRLVKEISNEIEQIDVNTIKSEIEKLKEKRIGYAKKLIINQISINLHRIDLSQLELDFKDFNKYTKLLEVFPVILCTNLSIPNSVAEGYKFDMGIIDEASQCDIPSSIPAIKRSHSLVVIGDDKQLSPITTIDARLDEYHIDKYKINNAIRYKDNSVFDAFKKLSNVNTYTFLDRHYRSKEAIIKFSNEMFYNSQLKVMTSLDEEPSIKLIDLKGHTNYSRIGSKSGYNALEVQAIVDYLNKLKETNFKGSIGVITPFRKQRQLLEDELIKNKDPFYQRIDVGTVHTFQGHEKDLILFSTVVSKNAKLGSIRWLNQMSKLLNVAITRAKNYFILVCDEEVLLDNEGILKELVLYINHYGNSIKYKPASIFDTLKGIGYDYKRRLDIKRLLNPYEEKLYQHLRNLLCDNPNYEVYPKIRVADVINIDRYKNYDPEKFTYGLKAHFDFVIFRYKNGAWPICAIELDGKQHTFDDKTVYRDKLKDDICRDMKFEIVRIKTDENIDIDRLIKEMLNTM